VIVCTDDKSDDLTYGATADFVFPKQQWTERELLACLEALKGNNLPSA